MATHPSDSPSYRFKSNVKGVLTHIGGQLMVIAVTNEYFKITGEGNHPNRGEHTYIGELLSGPHDGLMFWLEPNWYERLEDWASPSDTP